MKSPIRIPILGSDQFANGFVSTPTGPIARIAGEWFSVNGTTDQIVDVRFRQPRGCQCHVTIPAGFGVCLACRAA